MKKVSIILPTYNGENFIYDSIKSVLNQTYSNWELIIVNDCSTDETLKIVNEFAQFDKRIKVINNKENKKLPASLNVGFSNATGDYYTWTSDDNMYKPHAIEKMVEYLNNNPDCDLISFNMDFIDEQGNFVKEFTDILPERTPLQLAQCCNIGACFMYRKEIAQKAGNYDETMFCAEDYEYWCKIALKGNIHYKNENYYQYRYNSSSLSATKKEVTDRKTLIIREKYTPLILDKYCKTQEEKIIILLNSFITEKNTLWLNLANSINPELTKKMTRKYKILSFLKKIFSITKTTNKKIIKIFGIKITRPLKEKDTNKDDKSFINHKIRKNSVLIVEPNPYHGEILPSFVKYFQTLGFNVDLFLRHENMKDLPFLNTEGLNIFEGCAVHLKNLLKLNKIKQYEYVFFSSSAYWERNRYFNSYLKYLKFIPKAKHGLLMVEHNIVPYLRKYKEEKFLKQKRLFSCSGLQNVPILSPCYYGDFEITNKNNLINFIAAGSMNSDSKNLKILMQAVQMLDNKGINNFKITLCGEGNFSIPLKARKYFDYQGRVTFDKLYQNMQKSDYILFLLDDKEPLHDRYKNGTTTGALNLSLGFKKPAILNEIFAKAYGLSNNCAIVYPENELYEAMKHAIELSQDEYSKMQNNLKAHADSIYAQSLENLEKAVKRNK